MRWPAAAVLLLLSPSAADAHTVVSGVGGFPGGLLHPLLVPAHTLTLIALGLLAGNAGPRTAAGTLAVFLLAAIAAFALIAMAYSTMNAEPLILSLGAAIGLVLAVNFIPPFGAAAILSACAAFGIMFDSVPQVPSETETAVSLAGTVLSATALAAVTAGLTAALPSTWRSIGVRVAGSWIAASAIMVLALRLAS